MIVSSCKNERESNLEDFLKYLLSYNYNENKILEENSKEFYYDLKCKIHNVR